LASQECLPREGRAAASCGVGVRLAMEAVVEWAERRKERLEENRSVVLDWPPGSQNGLVRITKQRSCAPWHGPPLTLPLRTGERSASQ
jgi:hypothetical protein